jgi:hypothetical protein
MVLLLYDQILIIVDNLRYSVGKKKVVDLSFCLIFMRFGFWEIVENFRSTRQLFPFPIFLLKIFFFQIADRKDLRPILVRVSLSACRFQVAYICPLFNAVKLKWKPSRFWEVCNFSKCLFDIPRYLTSKTLLSAR